MSVPCFVGRYLIEGRVEADGSINGNPTRRFEVHTCAFELPGHGRLPAPGCPQHIFYVDETGRWPYVRLSALFVEAPR